MKHLIIISTYNSEKTILDVITKIKENKTNIDFLIIDRGSTDRTKTLIRNNNFTRLEMPLTASYYKAISLGLMFAHDNGYDGVIEFDDKGIFKVSDLILLSKKMKKENKDFVLGSRYINKKILSARSRILRLACFLSTRKKITDPGMRLKVYGKRAINFFATKINYNEPTPDRIVQLIKSGFTFCEVKVEIDSKVKIQNPNPPLVAIKENIGWILSILFVNPFRKRKEL